MSIYILREKDAREVRMAHVVAAVKLSQRQPEYGERDFVEGVLDACLFSNSDLVVDDAIAAGLIVECPKTGKLSVA